MTDSIVVSVPGADMLKRLGDLSPSVSLVEWDPRDPAPRDEFDLIVLPYLSSLSILDGLAGVRAKLVQSPAIGYDGIADRLEPGHVVANGASVHETATAEMTVALALAAQRDLPGFHASQASGKWAGSSGLVDGLADRRVLLIGYGGVGRAVASRLAPFEVDLVVVASHARTDDDGTPVRGIDELPDLLPSADIVIVAVPLSDRTRHLIDDAALSQLRPGSLVVNTSRGAVADTDAMVRQAGRLRFALDVTDPEPLPEGHPLWAQDGVIITPHAAAKSRAMGPRWERLVRRQIALMLAGEPPVNVVIRT